MRIAIDSADFPAETRHETWRRLLYDTYGGFDCDLPEAFRSVVEGYAVGLYSILRITSTRRTVARSPSLIRRDRRELIFFGMALGGDAVTVQNGREARLAPGTIVVSDSSRPLVTHIRENADIVWLAVPKQPMADRVRDIEDRVARPLRSPRPVHRIAEGLMAGFDDLLDSGLMANDAERLMTQLLDFMALTILMAEQPSATHAVDDSPIK